MVVAFDDSIRTTATAAWARSILEKPFYSLGSRRAGGVSLIDDQRIDARYDLGEIIDRFATHEKHATVYWGKSAGLVDGWVRRFTAGVTIDEHAFSPAPGFDAPLLLPADRKLVYPWIGAEWVEDAFETARNRDQIEKTEDYSLGWRARAQLGFASSGFGSDRDAIMLSGGVAKGLSLSERQSMFFGVDAGGRLENGAVAGGLMQADARYYFRQSPRRLLFMNLSATAGANLDPGSADSPGRRQRTARLSTALPGRRGPLAVHRRAALVHQLVSVSAVQRGRRGVLRHGRDLGPAILSARPHKACCATSEFGLRLGSSRSARGNVLHIDVAFPLDGDSSVRSIQYLIETKAELLMSILRARFRPMLRDRIRDPRRGRLDDRHDEWILVGRGR